jgi:eukaryotic-like serine/threonine-protein kinase
VRLTLTYTVVSMPDQSLLHERYLIQHRLGSGAFATVYLAEDLRMSRPVAVKVVEDSSDVDGRALREARAAAKLNHAHIVHVYEVVREKDRTLLFTEYVEGSTLRELYSQRRLSDREILEVGVQVCRALEHAHGRGVVHRDIKPENLMLVEGEEVDVRVMDFGVARLEDLASITLDGELVGTLAYMAPEQLGGQNVDSRADVYALGITLYEGLAGRNPLRGKDVLTLVRETATTVIPRLGRERPDLPAELEETFRQALERDPELRLDAASFRSRLQTTLGALPEPIPREPLEQRVRGFLRHGRRLERLAFAGRHAVAAVSALGTLGYLLPRMPFYPPEALFALVALVAFAALLWPAAGGFLTLVLLAPPAFAFGTGWGVLYLAGALPLFLLLRWRGLAWAALLPGLAPLLTAVGLGLTLPPLAGALLRRWGPLAGVAAGFSIAVSAGFAGWDPLPHVFTPGPGPVLLTSRYLASPGAAAEELARLLDLRPELLLQAALFGLFSLPLARFLVGEQWRRLWVAAVYLAALFGAFVLLPPLLLGVSVALVPFLAAYLPCVIIVLLYTLLASPEGSRTDLEG